MNLVEVAIETLETQKTMKTQGSQLEKHQAKQKQQTPVLHSKLYGKTQECVVVLSFVNGMELSTSKITTKKLTISSPNTRNYWVFLVSFDAVGILNLKNIVKPNRLQ